jgi:hypothetical protein
MRAVIQAAIGKALLVLEAPMAGAIGDDDSAVHHPGRSSGVVGGTFAPPEICETCPSQDRVAAEEAERAAYSVA